MVSEVSTDVEKIAGAAAKIENAQWRSAIQPKILRAFHIDADPVGRVFVPVDPAGIWPIRIIFAQSGKFCPIKRRQDAAGVYRMGPAAEVLPKTLKQFKGKQLLDFARQFHFRRDEATLQAFFYRIWETS